MASSAVALHPKGTGLHGEVDRVPADLDNATAVKATVTTEDVKSEAEAQTVKSRTISPFKAPGYIRYKVNSPTHEGTCVMSLRREVSARVSPSIWMEAHSPPAASESITNVV